MAYRIVLENLGGKISFPNLWAGFWLSSFALLASSGGGCWVIRPHGRSSAYASSQC
jgi:hypothetical protein